MPLLIRDWFFLKHGRDNFKPNVISDSRLILCHEDLVQDEIIGSIERRFAANEPVKMLLYGDYGIGKTHTLYHIAWWLEENKADYPVHTVQVEVGDITKTTRFDVLVSQFLDVIGLDELIRLTHAFQQSHPNVAKSLEKIGIPASVASAIHKFNMTAPGDTPSPVVVQSFEYLKGRKPSAQALQMGLGLQLTDSNDLYFVLLAIGEMHRAVYDRRLLFMADEATKLEAIEADDATQAHWLNANKLILDDNNNTFGFIYTVSGRRKNLPQVFSEPQIQNRLGDNAIELKNLAPEDVGHFLGKLREHFVDRPAVEAAVEAGEIPRDEYSWDTYPFTASGLDHFIDFFARAQENAKPRDISGKLDDAAFVAAKTGRRLIDVECLQKAKM